MEVHERRDGAAICAKFQRIWLSQRNCRNCRNLRGRDLKPRQNSSRPTERLEPTFLFPVSDYPGVILRFHLTHTQQNKNGSYQADRTQVHRWQGPAQAARHQGRPQVGAGHRRPWRPTGSSRPLARTAARVCRSRTPVSSPCRNARAPCSAKAPHARGGAPAIPPPSSGTRQIGSSLE